MSGKMASHASCLFKNGLPTMLALVLDPVLKLRNSRSHFLIATSEWAKKLPRSCPGGLGGGISQSKWSRESLAQRKQRLCLGMGCGRLSGGRRLLPDVGVREAQEGPVWSVGDWWNEKDFSARGWGQWRWQEIGYMQGDQLNKKYIEENWSQASHDWRREIHI